MINNFDLFFIIIKKKMNNNIEVQNIIIKTKMNNNIDFILYNNSK